jgi:hypothetical protein
MIESITLYVCDDCEMFSNTPGICVTCEHDLKETEFIRSSPINNLIDDFISITERLMGKNEK